ncbi:MAG: hypothetical protein L0Y56_21380, partial [Nitrospira sp.]|nr:hypothetical protein [Nitrospira sp.]
MKISRTEPEPKMKGYKTMHGVSKLTAAKTDPPSLDRIPPTASYPTRPGQPVRRFRQVLLNYLRRTKWGLSLAALSMLAYTLMELLSPWPLKIIFDNILLDHPLPATFSFLEPLFQQGKLLSLSVLAGCIALIATLSSGFTYFQIYLTSRIGYQLIYTLRTELFTHLQRLSLSFHQRARRGEILTNIATDTSTLKELFTESLLEFLTSLLTLIGMLLVMFVVNWQLSLIVLLTFPVL